LFTSRKTKFGTRKEIDILAVLRSKKETLEAKGTTLLIDEDSLTVVVVTPIMKRAHKLRFSSETCFVDSTGSVDEVSFKKNIY